jgi:hypothetical protein
MDFSFIIINYKTPDLTIQCLESIFKYCKNENFEIIIIDNNSGYDSVQKIKNKYNDRISYFIENKKDLGFSKANNQGAKVAKGKYLYFLNNDAILTENILPTIKEIFSTNEKIGIVSPLVKNPSGENQKTAMGKFPTLSSLISLAFKVNEEELIPKNKEKLFIIDWVSGCSLAIRKKVFNEINGWDENFFLYFEDTDICRRAYLKKYLTAIALNISLIHLGGQSVKFDDDYLEVFYKSRGYYFKKHYGYIICFLMKTFRFFYSSVIRPLSKKFASNKN